jgi:hypothetical protein
MKVQSNKNARSVNPYKEARVLGFFSSAVQIASARSIRQRVFNPVHNPEFDQFGLLKPVRSASAAASLVAGPFSGGADRLILKYKYINIKYI